MEEGFSDGFVPFLMDLEFHRMSLSSGLMLSPGLSPLAGLSFSLKESGGLSQHGSVSG